MAAAMVGVGLKPTPTYEMHDTHLETRWQPKAEGRAGIDRHETSLSAFHILSRAIPPNAARPPMFRAMRVGILTVITATKQRLGEPTKMLVFVLIGPLGFPDRTIMMTCSRFGGDGVCGDGRGDGGGGFETHPYVRDA